MAKEDWIKIHTDIIDDVKIRRLSKIPESFRMWVGLLCLCRRDGIDNCVCINQDIPYETEELAKIMMVPHSDFLGFLKEAEKLRMIEVNDGFIFILNWDKRQYIDNGRAKNFRKKQKRNALETDVKQIRNALETQTEQNKNTVETGVKRFGNAIETELKRERNAPETELKRFGNGLETDMKRNGNASETELKRIGNRNETVEQNRTEQNRTEQSRTEQKQNREEQTAEQSRIEEKQIPVAAAVASFASVLGKGNCSAAAASPGGGYRPIASELVRIGVSLQKTEELLSRHSEESIRNQINWLPFRNLNKPVAGLIKAIEQSWEMPAMPQTEKQKAEMEHLTKVRKCAEKDPDCARLNVDICSQCPNVLKKRLEMPDT